MRSLCFVAAAVCVALARPAAAETLTNEQVVQLAKAGLGDQVLIAKIRVSDRAFDTSTGALLDLRKRGVSNPVIAEMIAVGNGVGRPGQAPVASTTRPARSADSPDPAVPHPPGIYLLGDWASPTRMIAIEPVASERTKTGNIIAYVLTGGLAKRSRKAVIAQAAAGIRTPRRRPLFYFFFDEGPAGSGSGAFWDSGRIASPADFNLIRFKSDGGKRELKIGSTNLWGSNSGVAEKDRIPCAWSRLAPGVYAVQPEAELEDGEYGFVNPFSGGGDGAQRVRVFDFSVGEDIAELGFRD